MTGHQKLCSAPWSWPRRAGGCAGDLHGPLPPSAFQTSPKKTPNPSVFPSFDQVSRSQQPEWSPPHSQHTSTPLLPDTSPTATRKRARSEACSAFIDSTAALGRAPSTVQAAAAQHPPHAHGERGRLPPPVPPLQVSVSAPRVLPEPAALPAAHTPPAPGASCHRLGQTPATQIQHNSARRGLGDRLGDGTAVGRMAGKAERACCPPQLPKCHMKIKGGMNGRKCLTP